MFVSIVEILDQAYYIHYEMEELIKGLQKSKENGLKQQYCVDAIDSSIDEIYEHSEKLYVYAKKSKCSVDYSIERDIQMILDYLEQVKSKIVRQNKMDILNSDSSKLLMMRSYLRRHKSACPTCFVHNSDKKMSVKMLNSTVFDMCGISGVWNEKYILHLGDWVVGLLQTGLHLGDDVIIYSSDNAYMLMLENAFAAERLFYDLESLTDYKKSQAIQLKHRFFNNRTAKKPQPVNLQNESGRIIIIAYSNALKLALHNIDKTKLTSKKDILKHVTWPRKGKGSWNYEKILRGRLAYRKKDKPLGITYQFQPMPGHLGNIFTRGVGRYGTNKLADILSVINKLTGQNHEKEKKLAKLFLNYKKGKSDALSADSLRENGFLVPSTACARRKLINAINKIAFLVCFQEVYRRKNQGYKKSSDGLPVKILELPFGVAVSSALKLIADGHLRMREVFDSDSKYGVFTGQSIMNKNIKNTIQKFNQLFVFFFDVYIADIFAFKNKSQKLYDVFEIQQELGEEVITKVPQNFYARLLRNTDEKTNKLSIS
ncbi:MAG: hypothetical protein PVI75_00440 [Gammaproteobacteria bacterium]|jgi:hypothetical protein